MPNSPYLSAPVSRRRLLTAAGGLGLLASTAPLLSACGDDGGSSGSSKIDFMNRWSDPTSQAAARKLFDDFEKATGVSVNNQVQPSNGSTYQPAVRNSFSSSSPPDLATDISGPEVFNLARAGVLMDLTAFYNSTIKPRAKAGATAGAVLDGKVWGISDGASVGNCVWYNPELLSKYGVDPAALGTLDAWIDAMTAIRSAGGTPLVIGAKDQWPGGHYLNDLVQRRLGSQQSTALYNRTVLPKQPDTPKWTDERVVAAFQDYLRFKPLFQKGFLGEAQATTDTLFISGKAAFYEMGSWFLSTLRSTPARFEPGVMLFPAVSGGTGAGNEVTLGSDTMIVSAKADRAAVEKFLEYFTRPETLVQWSAAAFTSEPYEFDAAKVQVDAKLSGLFGKVNGFVAGAGPDGAALFNDQAIDVNVYTKYIWQGSVGLMAGDVTPQQLAQQLEDATVAAAKKLDG